MLGHRSLVDYQLKRIAQREGLDVALDSPVLVREPQNLSVRSARSEFPIIFADRPYGVLTLTKPLDSHRSLTQLGFALGLGQITLFVLGTCGLYLWARRFLMQPVEELARAAHNGFESPTSFCQRWVPKELSKIQQTFAALWQRREKDSNDLAIAKISKQVAHDIRSPLAALEMVVRYSTDMPEDCRTLLEGAANRVRDIADALLKSHRTTSGRIDAQAAAESVSIWPLVETIAAEKRCEYRDRRGLTISCHMSPAAISACVCISHIEMGRLLSNLVNNSVEACAYDGAIELRVDVDNMVRVSVSDSGPGMKPGLVDALNRNDDILSTKPGGHGLGLRHARELVSSAGGYITFQSTIGQGTSVNLALPASKPPTWLAEQLFVPANTDVHVLDDDDSAHQV